MTRLTLSKDMAKVRTAAKAKIDARFDRRYFEGVLLQQGAFTAQARELKLAVAREVMTGASGTALQREADLRGIGEAVLAEIVIQKAAEAAALVTETETRRQEQTLALLAMNTPAEVDAHLASLGLPPHDAPPDGA